MVGDLDYVGHTIGCVPLYAPLCAPMGHMGHMFYCAPLFIYCEDTDDDTDAYGKIIMHFIDIFQFLNSFFRKVTQMKQ